MTVLCLYSLSVLKMKRLNLKVGEIAYCGYGMYQRLFETFDFFQETNIGALSHRNSFMNYL